MFDFKLFYSFLDRTHATMSVIFLLHFLIIQRENRDTSPDSSIPMRLPTQHFRPSIRLLSQAMNLNSKVWLVLRRKPSRGGCEGWGSRCGGRGGRRARVYVCQGPEGGGRGTARLNGCHSYRKSHDLLSTPGAIDLHSREADYHANYSLKLCCALGMLPCHYRHEMIRLNGSIMPRLKFSHFLSTIIIPSYSLSCFYTSVDY